MILKADLHCHTLASDHAYSTLYELLIFAKQRGLEIIAMTDHAPRLPDSPNIRHFKNLRTIPEDYDGIRILKGAELNIIDENGSLDMPDERIRSLDWVIASFHDEAYCSADSDKNTNAWLNIVKDARVDMLGHPDRRPYVFEHETVIKACAEYGKVVEVNNHSFRMVRGNIEALRDIVLLCKKYGVFISINSDAHICFDVGVTDDAERFVRELGYPEELIINYHPELVLDLISKKRGKNG